MSRTRSATEVGLPEPDSAAAPGALTRHVTVAVLAGGLGLAFWASRLEWDPEMRLWRAVGDSGFALLAFALAAGPITTLWPRARVLLLWRRPLGIWFALTSLLHAYLVWDGWARWSLARLFGYQDLPLEDGTTTVLTDPGFGLANLVGLVALFWALIIAAVSSDRALAALGPRSWKYVQQFSYVVFYLVGLHAAYFLFLHYELSLVNLVFQKGLAPPNWFGAWFAFVFVAVLVLQLAAFVRIVANRRRLRAA